MVYAIKGCISVWRINQKRYTLPNANLKPMSNTTNKEQTAKQILSDIVKEVTNDNQSSFQDMVNDGDEYREKDGIGLVAERIAIQAINQALQLSAHCKEKDGWVPITEYDSHARPYVIRWHKLWKCPICVCMGKRSMEGSWVEKTLTTHWPNDAFEPVFKPHFDNHY